MINTQLLNISKILSVPNLDIKIISDPEQIKNKTIEKEHLNFDVISDIEDNSLTGKVFENYSIASSKINWSDNLFLSGMTCVLGTFSAATGKLEYRETIMATTEFLEVKKGDTIEILDDRFWFVPYLWNLDGTYNSSKAAWESGTYTFQFDCLVKIVVKLTDSSSDIKKYLNDIDKILSLPNNDIKYITNSSQIKDNVIEKNNLAFEIDNKSRLNNKKWATLGDSITARGWYQEAIKNESGINFINFGLGGSTITKNTGYNVKSFTERMIDLPDELDFLTIWGGVNDFGFGKFGYVQGSVLGDFDSRDDTTFFGALHKIFEYVIPKYKNKNTKIGFIVTTPVSKELGMFDKNAKGFYLADYCDAAKKVCEYYSIPYLDFQKNSGISELNVDVMTSTIDGGSSDGLHPSKIWIELKKYSILNFLESL